MDKRLKAIRDDVLVGDGSCSVIDECCSDAELIEELNKANITSAMEAINWAHKIEGLYLEQGLNQRWGEMNDSQLLAVREWEAKLAQYHT